MLHPQARRALEQVAGEPKVFSDEVAIADAREAARIAAELAPREQVAEVRDLDADGVRARLYVPADARPGLILHLHGGGFVFNDIDVHDGAARAFANRAGLAVLSVDYRRPPEHPFPAAPDDVDTVLGWLDGAGRDVLGGGPLVLHGDSAGGNLALVAALRHPGRAAALVLIYPFLDPEAGFASYTSETDKFDAREAAWYWQQYAPGHLEDPDVAPLRSSALGTLPPTLIVTAEHDPLRDEGEHLASLLAEQGVTVVATRYLGQIHGYWRHADAFDVAEPTMWQVAGFLRQHC